MSKAATLLDGEKLGLALFLLLSVLLHLVAFGQLKMGGDAVDPAEEDPTMAAVEVRLVPPEKVELPVEEPIEEILPPPVEKAAEPVPLPKEPEELAHPTPESEIAPAELEEAPSIIEPDNHLPPIGDVAPLPRQPQPDPPSSGERLLSWEETIRAQLAAAKHYPRRALKDGVEGEGQLELILGDDGRLLSARLHTSSGDARLDREILAMVERAAPFAPPPAGGEQALLVPVVFGLR